MSRPQPVSPKQAIDFLNLVQALKTTKRTGWVRRNIQGPESIADHSYRMGLMAMLVQGTKYDYGKCLKLSLVHDVAESIVGDITPHCGVSDEDKFAQEAAAVKRIKEMLGGSSLAGAEIEELWHEYEEAATPEANLVKDFDKVEMILQALEYEQAQRITLQEFFDSTAGKWRTEIGRSWAEEKTTQAGAMGALVDEALELTFHGEGYLVTVRTTTEQCLAVDIERREDATVWKGTFAAKYIEEITQRTHNYKSFPVFVHMLVTALRQESDSVFVDLLTYSDLELLKSKRAGQQQQQPPPGGGGAGSNSSSSPANNKRYLILTYAAEFDRVHYPLPLQQEDADPQRLRDVIKQLRQQLGSQQKRVSGTAQPGLARRQSDCLPELRAVRDENHMLRQQLCKLNTRLQGGMESDVQQLTAEAQETVKDLRQMRKERDTLLLRAQQAEAALEAERNLQRRELRRKVKEQQDMAAELAAAKDQIRELRLKCRELTQELDLAQRRAKVANLRASYLDRARQVGPRPPGRSAAVTPTGSRGVSPAGSRQPSRGGSPAPARRALQPAGLPQRSRSAGPERPSSTPRFDPTEEQHPRLQPDAKQGSKCRTGAASQGRQCRQQICTLWRQGGQQGADSCGAEH
ncbi:hypothetical protein N2152v2_007591 [Parachlorella kessleri]